jgi:hypothetical protein
MYLVQCDEEPAYDGRFETERAGRLYANALSKLYACKMVFAPTCETWHFPRN